MRILVIEDDREALAYLVKALRESGHVADQAQDGIDGYAMASEGGYDVLVIDRMLPKLDGLSVIRSLREQKVETPVLILSALSQVDDRVKGLRAGGDDYLLEALFVLGAPRPSRGPGQARRTLGRRRADQLPGRRPRTRPPVPSRDAGRAGDPPPASRVQAPGIPRPPCRPGRDPDDAARTCLGLPFRSADERDRRSRVAAPGQDRPRFR